MSQTCTMMPTNHQPAKTSRLRTEYQLEVQLKRLTVSQIALLRVVDGQKAPYRKDVTERNTTCIWEQGIKV